MGNIRQSIDIVGSLCETLHEMRLYRGDGQHVELFDVGQTDVSALLGPGIYLTSDIRVAGDYTAARGEEKVYPVDRRNEESFTNKELFHNYVLHLASEFDETAFKNAWCQARGMPRYNGLPSNLHRELDDDLARAKDESRAKKMPAAIATVRSQLPELRIFKLTTGALRLVKAARPAAISAFEVPEDYLAKTLHADRPLSDRALAVVRSIWFTRFPKDDGDMRDHRENRVSFDNYVANYKKFGTRYAWREDDEPKIGGKGENPSLDDIMNGTHGGYHAMKDSPWEAGRPLSTQLINGLRELGFVGLEYDGGVRVGQHVRGGGGVAHRAFVFWNATDIQRFRLANAPLPPVKKPSVRSLPR